MSNPPGVAKPTFEHHRWDTLVTGHTRPRISWKFVRDSNTLPAWEQTAYEIEISTGEASTPVRFQFQSNESVLVPWPVGNLQSREKATARVRSCGTSNPASGIHESWTAWSESATIEAGLLSPDDWSAKWIVSTEKYAGDGPLQPLRFYKRFAVPAHQEPISNARLYITSLGVFDAYINGSKASDEFMAPGWTSYNHRLAYRTLDVAPLLRSGGAPNSICIEVAEGWYAGRLAFNGGKRFCYGGDELAVLAQLEVHFGSNLADPWTVATDESWLCHLSGIQSSEIYDGETYDMRKETDNWESLILSADEKEFTPTNSFYCTFNAGQWPPHPIVGAYQKVPAQTTIAE
ncbi:hypothetical protein AK830_g10779 [Neonectria ditissima]|uniref:Bacterial alpha-L-rhamnosidase N-terminal domain-containing protein n=1 Tax=Neonectria ditissima TaxID=78410 RepID=A0A0P7B2X7_9HYPO|nr:hypothetical protein AK830_g10779 [Neonectria ditissima]